MRALPVEVPIPTPRLGPCVATLAASARSSTCAGAPMMPRTHDDRHPPSQDSGLRLGDHVGGRVARPRSADDRAAAYAAAVIDLRDTIRSTGTVRAFTAEPVDDATLAAVLDDARFAPSGGNRQPWRVAVVHDATVREQLAALIQPVWTSTHRSPHWGDAVRVDASPHLPSDRTSPTLLLDEIQRIPVVLAIVADGRKVALMDGGLDRPALTGGASVYPFCWNLLLAALGTWPRWRHHDVPLVGRAGGRCGPRPASVVRPRRDRLPRPPRPPTDPVASSAGGHVRHRRRFDGPAFDVEPERVPMSDEASTDGATSHVAPNDDRTPLPAIDERADSSTSCRPSSSMSPAPSSCARSRGSTTCRCGCVWL